MSPSCFFVSWVPNLSVPGLVHSLVLTVQEVPGESNSKFCMSDVRKVVSLLLRHTPQNRGCTQSMRQKFVVKKRSGGFLRRSSLALHSKT